MTSWFSENLDLRVLGEDFLYNPLYLKETKCNGSIIYRLIINSKISKPIASLCLEIKK